jgi:GxxExxY protein
MNGMNGISAITRAEAEAVLREVVGACYEVSNILGAGFLEKVYERALEQELGLRGLRALSQHPIRIDYKGLEVGHYIADLFVEGKLIVELKCCEELSKEHIAQCLNYLRATGLPLAVLVNFQHPHMEWRKVVNKHMPYVVHTVHAGQ